MRARYFLLSLSGHKRLTRRRQRPGDIFFFWIPLAYLHIFSISISTYLQFAILLYMYHVLIILLMKIKFFRQKRQAAEEKRKEERSALETVRMEYLISSI